MKPRFFATPSAFRSWLERNHQTAKELWVGYHRKGSQKPSLTWSESVDVALCFGWIDGVRKRIDEQSYKIRFTPRRPGSRWSAINVEKVKALQKLGLMRPAGVKLFQQRLEKAGYSYENREGLELDASFAEHFHSNKEAWQFFETQAPSYKKVCIYWVMSAAQPETRARRLSKLIAASAQKKRL